MAKITYNVQVTWSRSTDSEEELDHILDHVLPSHTDNDSLIDVKTSWSEVFTPVTLFYAQNIRSRIEQLKADTKMNQQVEVSLDTMKPKIGDLFGGGKPPTDPVEDPAEKDPIEEDPDEMPADVFDSIWDSVPRTTREGFLQTLSPLQFARLSVAFRYSYKGNEFNVWKRIRAAYRILRGTPDEFDLASLFRSTM